MKHFITLVVVACGVELYNFESFQISHTMNIFFTIGIIILIQHHQKNIAS